MSLLMAVGVWLAVDVALRPNLGPRGGRLAAGLGFATWNPVLAAAAGVAFAGASAKGRLRQRRLEREAADADVSVLADLTVLGLRAGLPFASAVGVAADHVAPKLRIEVRGMLRVAAKEGLAASLETVDGRARRLYRLAGRAVVTGAPLAASIGALAEELRREDHAKRLIAARRLPVRLLFPLALLILPGFLLLLVGPTLLGAVERLTS